MGLIDKIHEMYKDDGVTADIFTAAERELESLKGLLTDLKMQGLLDFATWYVEKLESELGITEKAPELAGRRDEVKMRLLTRGDVSMEKVREMCRHYAGYAEAEFTPERYTIAVTVSRDVADNFTRLKGQLRDYVPAHILLTYAYYARTHGEIKAKKLTHGDLKKFTHREIREKAELT